MTASPPCSPPTPDRRDHRHRIILGVGNAGAHRVRRWASFGATVVTSSVLAIMGTAGTAAASPDNGVCVLEQEPIQWKQSAFIPDNGHTNLVSEAGYVNGDLLRFRASGNTQIATWGDHKDPNGDAAVAPDNGRWPAPGVRKYALLMRITAGNVEFESTGIVADSRVLGTTMVPWRWYAVDTDSGCLRVLDPPPFIEFEINDDNIGDNNDGPTATLEQWW